MNSAGIDIVIDVIIVSIEFQNTENKQKDII